jgi:hypothetical protein
MNRSAKLPTISSKSEKLVNALHKSVLGVSSKYMTSNRSRESKDYIRFISKLVSCDCNSTFDYNHC